MQNCSTGVWGWKKLFQKAFSGVKVLLEGHSKCTFGISSQIPNKIPALFSAACDGSVSRLRLFKYLGKFMMEIHSSERIWGHPWSMCCVFGCGHRLITVSPMITGWCPRGLVGSWWGWWWWLSLCYLLFKVEVRGESAAQTWLVLHQ